MIHTIEIPEKYENEEPVIVNAVVVRVELIPRYGSCLFSALLHQQDVFLPHLPEFSIHHTRLNDMCIPL